MYRRGASAKRRSLLVKIYANRRVDEVIAIRRARVTDGISNVARHLRVRLEVESGREIPGGVLARIPVGGDADLRVNRLLETELPARALRVRCDDVVAEVIAARRQPRIRLESLADLRVEVVAEVV